MMIKPITSAEVNYPTLVLQNKENVFKNYICQCSEKKLKKKIKLIILFHKKKEKKDQQSFCLSINLIKWFYKLYELSEV